MFNFIKVFFILFLVVQTTVSPVVSMERCWYKDLLDENGKIIVDSGGAGECRSDLNPKSESGDGSLIHKERFDFCFVGELSGRRFVISNGKFDGDFTFYSHTNVKEIDEWSLTTFDKGMFECTSIPTPKINVPFEFFHKDNDYLGEEYDRIFETYYEETQYGNQNYVSYCLVNDFFKTPPFNRDYQHLQETNHQIKSFYHSLGGIGISLRSLIKGIDLDEINWLENSTDWNRVPDDMSQGELVLGSIRKYPNRYKNNINECTEDDWKMVSERKNQ